MCRRYEKHSTVAAGKNKVVVHYGSVWNNQVKVVNIYGRWVSYNTLLYISWDEPSFFRNCQKQFVVVIILEENCAVKLKINHPNHQHTSGPLQG